MDNWQEGKTSPEENENPSLDRSSALNKEGLQKYSSYWKLGLTGALAIALILFLNHKPKQEGNSPKEGSEFELAPRKEMTLPSAPPAFVPSLPVEKKLSDAELVKLQQAEALKQARLKSAMIVSSTSPQIAISSENSASPDSAQSGNGNPNIQFQQQLEKSITPVAKAVSLHSLAQKTLQGKLIDAVLETAIHSDLPGMVRAMVIQDVYAESGNQILIPRGSRLVGQYNSQVAQGQSRLFVIWKRLIRPDGIEIALNSTSTDPLGMAGIGGEVNHHFWKMFGSSILLSLLNAGVSSGGVGTMDAYNSLSAYRQQVGESFQNTSSKILENSINLPPTIEVKSGTLIKVFVARDLDFTEVLSTKPSMDNFMVIR